MEEYRRLCWSAWTLSKKPIMTDIPVAKAQLLGRANDFDGGRTAAWMASLETNTTWRAVRDPHTGHTIHCVSDRSWSSLTADLILGLRLLAWMSQKTAVTWYWWDQPWTRILPSNTKPRKEHLNGGWATPGVPEIHVYRREEAHKVMIHETIHALGLDVDQASVDPIRPQFEADLGHRLWPHLGEAFTEFYAEWLWSISAASSLQDARKRWLSQLACSEGQAATVWRRIRGSTEDENTNVFAYYVLKWVLMGHQAEVLLGPKRTVSHWFGWWVAAKPRLEQLSEGEGIVGSESIEIKMGMTCDSM
jgi:hypothetical protein